MTIGVLLALQHILLQPRSRSIQMFQNPQVSPTQGTLQHNCRIHHMILVRLEPTLYGIFRILEILMLESILDPIHSVGTESEHCSQVGNTQLLALSGKLLQIIDQY